MRPPPAPALVAWFRRLIPETESGRRLFAVIHAYLLLVAILLLFLGPASVDEILFQVPPDQEEGSRSARPDLRKAAEKSFWRQRLQEGSTDEQLVFLLMDQCRHDQDQLDNLERVLAGGMSPDTIGAGGERPLTILASNCDCPSQAVLAKILMAHGADVEAAGTSGRRPLHWAAIRQHWDLMAFLLRNGADVNAEDADHQTALLYATYWGNLRAVRFLIEAGADPNHWTWSGFSIPLPLGRNSYTDCRSEGNVKRYATRNGSPMNAYDIAFLLGHRDCWEYLKEQGAEDRTHGIRSGGEVRPPF